MRRVQIIFIALIAIAGIAGGLIGFALVDVQCTGACGAPRTYGGLIGVLIAAFGMGVVATLILRSMTQSGQKQASKDFREF
jgi:hypothetical protein